MIVPIARRKFVAALGGAEHIPKDGFQPLRQWTADKVDPGHRAEKAPQAGSAETDRFAPLRCAMRPGARRRTLRDAEIDGAEVSRPSPFQVPAIR